MKTTSRLILGALATAGLLSPVLAGDPAAAERDALPVEIAVLTSPPAVPPPIRRRTPARVVVKVEVREVVMKIADEAEYTFWTYGGSVPGSFIRIREGDTVEFELDNHPSSKVPHNIDLHAVTGPGGGAGSTFTAPGHSSRFTFRAINPGLYVYHCATAPVPMHIGNGMYGLILVEPKDGLPPVDREYYVMQGEFYTDGRYGEAGLRAFDTGKSIDERPTYVLFNGSVGSLVGEKAITAKAGETVRIFFGVGGPNLASSFHVIGEIFDRVWTDGAMKAAAEHVQTTLVPPGGAVVAEFKVQVPGTYVLVDHSLSRAFNKGALGMLSVTGPEDPAVYSGKEVDAVYLGSQPPAGVDSAKPASAPAKPAAPSPKVAAAPTDPEVIKSIKAGKKVYEQTCFACHLADGKGIPGTFPPLAGSDYFAADRERAIRVVLKGLQGPVKVNGKDYNGVMPELGSTLNDRKIADVLTYVANSWGNSGDAFTADEVRDLRKSK